ncbi:MAG TPA: FmdB family zinc ribbon protein [Candidatus Binatia bacterium]|nr:FmdB family zinc ribbon protein [Candidatus Binatia bacterium]
MPIYEYRCPKCGDFDVMQKITDKPLRKCPTCKAKVSKLVSSTAFQLKGTGWYVTDYAKKGKPAEGKDGGSGDSKSNGSGDSASAKADAGGGSKEASSPKDKPAKGKTSSAA